MIVKLERGNQRVIMGLTFADKNVKYTNLNLILNVVQLSYIFNYLKLKIPVYII